MYVYSIAKTHQPIDPKTHQKPWVDGFWGKNPGFLGTLGRIDFIKPEPPNMTMFVIIALATTGMNPL
jgi:hypothetical protein